jgi:hypothetical protein
VDRISMTSLNIADVTQQSIPVRQAVWKRPLRLSAVILIMVGLGASLLAGTTMLPHDPYIRYQTLRGTFHERAVWVYERIHFDPTPIDVLLVGPSRMATGVDGPALSKLLSQQMKVDIKAVNFAFTQPGEDLDYVIAKETLSAKRVKLIVAAVTEQESRTGHPAFRELADRDDVVKAPILFNRGFLKNLAYLPMRQLRLAWYTLNPAAGGYQSHFNPAAYEGSELDTRKRFTWRRPDEPENLNPTEAQLALETQRYERTVLRRILPPFLDRVEFAVARTYFAKIKELADQHGAKLVLLYLPYYKGPEQPFDSAKYENIGPILKPSFLISDWTTREDSAHYSDSGAAKLTAWLSIQLEPYLRNGS